MKKKLIGIVFLVFASLTAASSPILDMGFVISEDGTVLEDRLKVTFGKESSPVLQAGDYSILILSIAEEVLFNETYSLDFFLLADPPSQVGYAIFEQKIPYTKDMYVLKFFKGHRLIYTKFLDFCNYNAECDGEENYLSCPQDCPLTSFDKMCISEADSTCDPDCLESADPDCKKPTNYRQITLIVLLLLILLSVIILPRLNLPLIERLRKKLDSLAQKGYLAKIKSWLAIVRHKIRLFRLKVIEKFK